MDPNPILYKQTDSSVGNLLLLAYIKILVSTTLKPPTKIKLRIIHVARRSFAKNGFSKTSMDEIAKSAKVSKGGLYHHFASKDELFMALFIENQESVRKSQPKLFEKRGNLLKDLAKFYDSLDFQEDLMRIWLEAMSESAHNSTIKKMVVKRRKQLEALSMIQFKQMKSNMDILSNYSDLELGRLAKGSLALIKGCALDSVTGDDPKLVKQTWIQTMYAILTSSK